MLSAQPYSIYIYKSQFEFLQIPLLPTMSAATLQGKIDACLYASTPASVKVFDALTTEIQTHLKETKVKKQGNLLLLHKTPVDAFVYPRYERMDQEYAEVIPLWTKALERVQTKKDQVCWKEMINGVIGGTTILNNAADRMAFMTRMEAVQPRNEDMVMYSKQIQTLHDMYYKDFIGSTLQTALGEYDTIKGDDERDRVWTLNVRNSLDEIKTDTEVALFIVDIDTYPEPIYKRLFQIADQSVTFAGTDQLYTKYHGKFSQSNIHSFCAKMKTLTFPDEKAKHIRDELPKLVPYKGIKYGASKFQLKKADFCLLLEVADTLPLSTEDIQALTKQYHQSCVRDHALGQLNELQRDKQRLTEEMERVISPDVQQVAALANWEMPRDGILYPSVNTGEEYMELLHVQTKMNRQLSELKAVGKVPTLGPDKKSGKLVWSL
jgi:hypothetical protein